MAKTKKRAHFGLPKVRSLEKPVAKPKKKKKKMPTPEKDHETILKEELADLVNRELLE